MKLLVEKEFEYAQPFELGCRLNRRFVAARNEPPKYFTGRRSEPGNVVNPRLAVGVQ